MITSIFVFFIIIFGLGSLTYIMGWSKEDFLERLFISAGVGLMLIPLAGVIFNLLRIPLDYKYFIILALATLGTVIRLAVKTGRYVPDLKNILKETFTPINIGILLLFALSLYMYLKGSFSYPWFEDQDPWKYAIDIKHIALNRTFNTTFRFSEAAEPYPQGYQIIMAILHQTNSSLSWTMKFFNCLITSFSIPFFYFFAKKLFSRKFTAFFATIILFSIPAWLTHFIFSVNLGVVFLPLFFYVILKMEEDKRWQFLAIIAFASLWLVQFYIAFVTAMLFLIYYLTRVICEENLNKHLVKVSLAGFVLSLLIFWIPSLLKFKDEVFIENKAPAGLYYVIPVFRAILQKGILTEIVVSSTLVLIILFLTDKMWIPALKAKLDGLKIKYIKPRIFILFLIALLAFLLVPGKMMPLMGATSIPYDFSHFFLLNVKGNYIQSPYGIGTVSMTLSLIGFLYCFFILKTLFTPENRNKAVLFLWFIFALLGVNSARFSVNIMPSRMWFFLAFSTALLAALFYEKFISDLRIPPLSKTVITFVLVVSLVPTWYTHKFTLNTKVWKENYLQIIQSQKLYSWIKDNLPKNSRVYAMGIDQFVPVSFDMLSFAWDREIYEYTSVDMEQSPQNNYIFLTSKDYEYVVVDPSSVMYKYTYTHKDLPEIQKKAEFANNTRLLTIKKIVLKNMPGYFLPVKEIENSGVIFKVLTAP